MRIDEGFGFPAIQSEDLQHNPGGKYPRGLCAVCTLGKDLGPGCPTEQHVVDTALQAQLTTVQQEYTGMILRFSVE
jgi:hypothetical protein